MSDDNDNSVDPLAADRAFYDETDFADVDLQLAEDVQIVPPKSGPRSTFAIRLHGETIEELRVIAERQGTGPTKLARHWLEERLVQEQRGPRRRSLEQRVDDLEGRLELLLTRARHRGVLAAWLEDEPRDEALLADLEAQTVVARELLRRLGGAVSVAVPSEAGADLVVRSGDRSWVIEFKAGAVDLDPSFTHLRELGERLGARPVLVTPDRDPVDVERESADGIVLVTRPEQLDDLVAEIRVG